MQGRHNTNAWNYTINTALGSVVGKAKLKRGLMMCKPVHEVASVSDEALARLILIKYHDSLARNWDKKHKTRCTTKKSKWTKKKASLLSTSKFKGWKNESIQVYNKIVEQILKERQDEKLLADNDLAHHNKYIRSIMA